MTPSKWYNSRRQPNVAVTDAEAEWLLEAARIVAGKDAPRIVRRKASAMINRIAHDAVRANHADSDVTFDANGKPTIKPKAVRRG